LKKNQWNIAAPKPYIDQLQTSKYYKQDLGKSLTFYDNKKGDRALREEEFSSWYYENYKSLIFKSGTIGSLHFYVDYYLKKEIIGFFLEKEEGKHQYAIEWDKDRIKAIGIDSWLGERLKEVDTMLEDSLVEDKEEVTEGDGSKLLSNPGGVSWKDIEDHFNKKKNI
tara:strand:- start:28539 stop:29039 length:501 start_codon:yes stop_codon:yes gene_type:complete